MWIPQENVDCVGTQDPKQTSTQWAQEPRQRLTFPGSLRLRSREDFARIRRDRTRYFGNALLIDYRIGRSRSPRLGITAPKQFGNAVLRNRFKRIVREIFRNEAPLLPRHLEINVFPKKGGTPPSHESVREDLLSCIKQIGRNGRAESSPEKSS